MTPPDPEAVLAQDDWLRRIARHLVDDPDLADDLVQDAWLASLQAGRRGTGARPWLMGVLRNAGARVFLSRDRHGARVIRDARDRLEPEVPAPDELVADLQVREILARELQALEEPFRTAVYLRFVTDVSIKELARRTRVAPSTASERVTRGLALLRVRMDRAHGGHRRTWIVTLLPLTRPKGLAALTLGTLVMHTSTKIAIASVALVGAFILSQDLFTAEDTGRRDDMIDRLGAGDHAEPDGLGLVDTLADVEIETSARNAVSVGRAPKAARPVPPEATAGGAKVLGRFLLPDGRAAAGARWKLHGWGANRARRMEHGVPENWTDPEGELDALGNLELVLDPPQAFQFSLDVWQPGHVTAGWRWGRIEPNETKHVGTYTLRPAGRVAGYVVDENGAPVIGRSVHVYAEERPRFVLNGPTDDMEEAFESTTADPQTGRFEIGGLPAGAVELRVQDKVLSGALRRPTVRIVAGETVEVDVLLKGVHQADSNIVLRLSTRPYHSAPRPDREYVWLIAPDGTKRNLGSRGRAMSKHTFKEVGHGPHRIVIDDPRFETWCADGVLAGEVKTARLKGSCTLAVNVRDSDGEPVSLYSVDIEFLGVNFYPSKFRPHEGKEPLEDGRLAGLLPGDYRVTVRGDSGSASLIVADLVASESRSISMLLVAPATIAGRVTRRDGAPAADVSVRLVTPAARDDSPSSPILSGAASGSPREIFRKEQARVRSAADGRYRFDVLIGGPYLIFVGEQVGPSAESDTFAFVPGEDVDGIELVLALGARIEGRIEVPAGLDLANWRVYPHRPGATNQERYNIKATTILNDGAFDTGHIAEGRVQLYLLQPGRVTSLDQRGSPLGGQLLEDLVLTDGLELVRAYPFPGPIPTEVTFKLDVAGGATGRCHLALYLVGEDSPTLIARGEPDELGPYRLPPGTYDVAISGEGWSHAYTEPITIEEGEPQVVQLAVTLLARRVQIVNGVGPVAKRRVFVTAQDQDLRMSSILSTDGEGFLDLRIASGDYRLNVVGSRTQTAAGVAEFRWPLADGVHLITVE